MQIAVKSSTLNISYRSTLNPTVDSVGKICWNLVRILVTRPEWGGVLPYMGYIGMCGPKGYGFSAVLVRNRVSILAILVIYSVWLFYSSLELGILLRPSYFFVIIDKTINRNPSKIMFRATVSTATVISRVWNFWSGHIQGRKNRRFWS